MSQGRITCPRCGSNNFDTVTACWKCGNSLTAAAAQQAVPSPRPAASGYSTIAAPAVPSSASVGQVTFADRVAAPAATVASLGNTAASNRAAFWLGILFPYFGLPIGLAFIMCDDRRRQEVGRLCIIWSLISGVIHLLLMFVSLIGMRQYIAMAFGAAQSGINNRMGGGGLGGGAEGGF